MLEKSDFVSYSNGINIQITTLELPILFGVHKASPVILYPIIEAS